MKFQNLARAAAGAALGLTLAFGTVAPALAASITINGEAGETYTAYKIFDVTYDKQSGSYSYYTTDDDLVSKLKDFGLTFSTDSSETYHYVVTTEAAGEVVFKGAGEDTITAAELAAEINTWSWDENDKAGFVEIASGSESGTINVDSAGYYFVDSSLGALCMLDTADDTVTINEKNTVPSVEKGVLEDSTGTYGDSATIDGHETIYYRLKVNTGSNSANLGTGVDSNYVIVDDLPEGVNFGQVTYVGPDQNGSSEQTGWTENTDYSVTTEGLENGDVKFELLSTGALSSLSQNQDVYIFYTAEAAESTNLTVDTSHTNTIYWSYKEQSDTDTALVKTFDIGDGFKKIDGDSEEDTPLSGVKFILSKGSGNEIQYAQINDGYLSGWTESREDATQIQTDSNGAISVDGLDADTYVLTETETKEGYNLLDDTITVVIDQDGKVLYKLTNSPDAAKNTITVENFAGSKLPGTGGMGTTVLYIVGGALVVGAGITLVVRRRMSAEA